MKILNQRQAGKDQTFQERKQIKAMNLACLWLRSRYIGTYSCLIGASSPSVLRHCLTLFLRVSRSLCNSSVDSLCLSLSLLLSLLSLCLPSPMSMYRVLAFCAIAWLNGKLRSFLCSAKIAVFLINVFVFIVFDSIIF